MRITGKIALDAYYTPLALAEACVRTLPPMPERTPIWEPHAGGGAFCHALWNQRAVYVFASDINPDAPAIQPFAGPPVYKAADALKGWPFRSPPPAWVVGNPPFTGVERHIDTALSVATVGVGFLLRLAILEGQKRKAAWKRWPLASVHVLVERPSFTGGGTDSAAYGFFRFERGYQGRPSLDWLSWRGV